MRAAKDWLLMLHEVAVFADMMMALDEEEKLLFEQWISDIQKDAVLATATLTPMTPELQAAQRESFVYGNLAIDNPSVTREMVHEAAEAPCPYDCRRLPNVTVDLGPCETFRDGDGRKTRMKIDKSCPDCGRVHTFEFVAPSQPSTCERCGQPNCVAGPSCRAESTTDREPL